MLLFKFNLKEKFSQIIIMNKSIWRSVYVTTCSKTPYLYKVGSLVDQSKFIWNKFTLIYARRTKNPELVKKILKETQYQYFINEDRNNISFEYKNVNILTDEIDIIVNYLNKY